MDKIYNQLLYENNFKSVRIIDYIVPDQPGLYAIRIIKPNILPEPFCTTLNDRKSNLIYIGLASQSLYKRMLNHELRAKGHGTFFRSLGAILGYRPQRGSLKYKRNQINYVFCQSDRKIIIDWIDNNLLVNWLPINGNLDEIETQLIYKFTPLINIAKNPLAMKELRDLRKECVEIALS